MYKRGVCLVVTCVVLLISGCVSVPTQENDQELTNGTESSRCFQKFLDDYMSNEIADISKTISFYKSQSAGMTEEEKDKNFMFIYKYFTDIIEIYNTLAFESNVIWEKLSNNEEAWGEDGVITISNEGYYFGMVSCTYLKDQLKGNVTQNVLDFLTIRGIEQQQVFQQDGAIMISWQDLAARCIAWEDYLTIHKNSPLLKEAYELHRIYESALLSGTNHTRVYRSNDKEWKDSPEVEEIRSVYKWLMNEYPQNKISEVIKEYLPLLENTGWSDKQSIEAFLEEHGIEPGYASRRMIQ